jgi:hypothetical protein
MKMKVRVCQDSLTLWTLILEQNDKTRLAVTEHPRLARDTWNKKKGFWVGMSASVVKYETTSLTPIKKRLKKVHFHFAPTPIPNLQFKDFEDHEAHPTLRCVTSRCTVQAPSTPFWEYRPS